MWWLQVIELGRTLRERQGRPLRTPLRCLTVAHAEPAFLDDLTGAKCMICLVLIYCECCCNHRIQNRMHNYAAFSCVTVPTVHSQRMRTICTCYAAVACDVGVLLQVSWQAM